MTQRDQKFLVILGGSVAGVALVGFLFYQWFWSPLLAYNASITKLEEENMALDNEYREFHKGLKRLNWAKLRSLPMKPDLATADYISYLQTMVQESGLQLEYLTPSNAVKMKAPASVPEIKEIKHQIITFTVKAFGEEKELVDALERMQRTPYEHRIKNLAIERTDGGYLDTASKKLKIDMLIEVLLVADNPNKMGLHPGVDPSAYLYNHLAARNGAAPAGWGLWLGNLAALIDPDRAGKNANGSAQELESRDYDAIARRNIFVGMMPKIVFEKSIAKEPTPPAEDVPAYVRLEHVVPSQQTAYLFNRLYGTRNKLIAKAGSGYEYFALRDEDDKYEFVRGKILAVGNREIYFQALDQVYVMHLDEPMRKVLDHPLTVEQLFETTVNGYDLYDLFDKDFAKEKGNDPKKRSKKGNKGR